MSEILMVISIILGYISALAVIVGLIKPSLVIRWGEKKTRIRSLLIYIPITIISFVIAALLGPTELKFINLSPENNTIVSSSEIIVKGKISKDAKVSINGNESLVKNMLFEESIPLKQGKNEIRLSLVGVDLGVDEEQKLITIIVTRVSEDELKEKKRLQKLEEKRIAKEKVEKERLKKLEEKRLAKEKAEKERLAKIIGKPDQYVFHTKIKEFGSRYEDEENQMKKSKIARELRDYSKKFLKFSGWKGELKQITTDEGGEFANIGITSTHNNKEISYQTFSFSLTKQYPIYINSKVYKQLEELEENDKVIFSGNFYPDSNRGLVEASLTENGWVTDPGFLVDFSNIKKQ